MKFALRYIILIPIFTAILTGCHNSSNKNQEKIYPETIKLMMEAYQNARYDSLRFAELSEKTKPTKIYALSYLLKAAAVSEGIQLKKYRNYLSDNITKTEEAIPQYNFISVEQSLKDINNDITKDMQVRIPTIIATAQKENATDIVKFLKDVLNNEKYKRDLFADPVNTSLNIDNMPVSKPKVFFVCSNCGFMTDLNHVRDNCPTCNTPQDRFIPIWQKE